PVADPSTIYFYTLSLHDALPIFHLVVRVDRLAGIAPVALEDVVLERARADVVVVDVRDLELAAARGLERRDDVEDVRAVAVEPRSEEHTSELQSRVDIVCRLLLE